MELRQPALEHGTTRPGRVLRQYRLRLALVVAVVEGLFVALDLISGRLALLVAALVIVFYLWLGRNLRSDIARQASWTAALSQVLVAIVPLLVFVVGALALVGVGILAVVALVALLSDRR